jgi:hypothetical protein
MLRRALFVGDHHVELVALLVGNEQLQLDRLPVQSPNPMSKHQNAIPSLPAVGSPGGLEVVPSIGGS